MKIKKFVSYEESVVKGSKVPTIGYVALTNSADEAYVTISRERKVSLEKTKNKFKSVKVYMGKYKGVEALFDKKVDNSTSCILLWPKDKKLG